MTVPGVSRRQFLAIEFGVLFVGLTTGYVVVLNDVSPIPFLVVAATGAVLYLRRDRNFDNLRLWNAGALRSRWRGMLALWAIVTVAMAAAVAVARPTLAFDLPRTEPLVWLAVVVFYPLLSVYPQELLFRAFLFHRYAPVFGTGTAMVAASAVVFGYVHIAFGSWISVAMTLVGGALFAWRYRVSQSLFVCSVEHALYGISVFTVGLGRYFFHGS